MKKILTQKLIAKSKIWCRRDVHKMRFKYLATNEKLMVLHNRNVHTILTIPVIQLAI